MDHALNLSSPRTALIGRRQLVADVCDLLRRDEVPLVTLTGPGGVGKTRLALQVAAELAPAFEDGVRLIELAPLPLPELVLPSIARIYGLADLRDRLPLDLVINHLASKRTLLVLDNFEHLLDAAPVLGSLLNACPGLTILTTSRTVLHLTDEQEVLVHPLPRSEAIQLFMMRARAVDANIALTAASAPVVAAICDRLDGLPLALELAAARIRTLPLAALLARLDMALTMLTGGARDGPDRHRTMRDAIGWSFGLLDEQEQLLLCRLAVFVDGFDLDGGAAVSRLDESTLLEGIASLVEKSLLVRLSTVEDAEPRFRMLEVVREFGWEQLVTAGEEASAQLAHATHYLALAEGLAGRFFTPEFDRISDRLSIEFGNIRAALMWCDESGASDLTLRLARAMCDFCMLRGHLREGQQWIDLALERASKDSSATRAGALASAGWLSIMRGAVVAAEAPLREAVEMASRVPDRWVEAAAMMGMAIVCIERRDLAEAVMWSDRQAATYRDLAPTAPVGGYWLSLSLVNRGQIAIASGDLVTASTVLQEAHALQLSLGFTWATGDTLLGLGDLRRETGNLPDAFQAYRESIGIGMRYGDLRLVTHAISGLAVAVAMQGQSTRAARMFGAVSMFRDHVGSAVSTWDKAAYARGLGLARSRLSEAEFDLAWAEGASLSLEQAVAEALAYESNQSTTLDGSGVDAADSDSLLTERLTARELEILHLLAGGLSDREIATTLSISPRTVNGHVTNILGKLGVESRTAAAMFAVRHGWV